MRSALSKLARRARVVSGRERPVVLMYHRVAETICDPWGIAVSPSNFAAQLAWLKQERDVVPLSWLTHQISRGHAPSRTIAITFDDGYADVLLTGKPILEQHGCPATVFLVTGALGSPGFWWDDLSKILLEPKTVPEYLEIEIAGHRHAWRISNDAGSDNSLNQISRSRLNQVLWRLLRPLGASARAAHIHDLASWANAPSITRESDRVLTSDEVAQLHVPGFIDVGAHTVSHPSLPLLDPSQQAAEIRESRTACEALIGTSVAGFAYPFGEYGDVSVRLVREAGFHFAVTTQPYAVRGVSDRHLLPRLDVQNWDAEKFSTELSKFA
jgi:peptidoglycan/xylan/chitin deacetylase (PgdA/CDA1 family)